MNGGAEFIRPKAQQNLQKVGPRKDTAHEPMIHIRKKPTSNAPRPTQLGSHATDARTPPRRRRLGLATASARLRRRRAGRACRLGAGWLAGLLLLQVQICGPERRGAPRARVLGGGMYAAHRHRRERGAHGGGGGGGGGGGAKERRGTSPVLFCFVAAAVLVGNACHGLFPQKKVSSHGFNWIMSLTPKPQGVKYELHTLPVDSKAVTDGDTITVHVVTADHPGSLNVPQEVQRTAADRAEALMTKNYQRADELQKIILDAGFRLFCLEFSTIFSFLHMVSACDTSETFQCRQVTDSRGGQVLMKKYRIRLRGIDAPETSMPYGREAKEELTMLVQGKRLKISVYGNDRYSRLVGDVDCNGVFVQEHMLKKGLAWHYIAYDQRPELARPSSSSSSFAGGGSAFTPPNPSSVSFAGLKASEMNTIGWDFECFDVLKA
uniref:TNase-like domain-containing protein n=1 Tax=Oryza barthii TaxID=65489 RepID=A0A0D3EJZ8_9ORYZ